MWICNEIDLASINRIVIAVPKPGITCNSTVPTATARDAITRRGSVATAAAIVDVGAGVDLAAVADQAVAVRKPAVAYHAAARRGAYRNAVRG